MKGVVQSKIPYLTQKYFSRKKYWRDIYNYESL